MQTEHRRQGGVGTLPWNPEELKKSTINTQEICDQISVSGDGEKKHSVLASTSI